MNRSCGILLHITSLPSRYGIGNLGQAAYDFVDFLSGAGQSCWQILPIGPTGYGDSPYQSFSAFAGNPYLIDPDHLIRQGWLTQRELDGIPWGRQPDQVAFPLLYRQRLPLLYRAYERFRQAPPPEFSRFCRAEAEWLEDYALFMALKQHFGNGPWTDWPQSLRLRDPKALARYRRDLAEPLNFQRFLQYEFYRQWDRLRAYAGKKGITIIGDIPIYVPLDSADLWCNPNLFQLDENRRPTYVAGCPPDGFSEDGQYWGNPIYDWAAMERDQFAWWLERIESAARLFDVIRIDHFRGLESYWSIPAHSKTARNGAWVKGPGLKLVNAIKARFPNQNFIAEDLGFLTEAVYTMVKESGFPGMKVLEFAFDSREPSDYLPDRYDANCICYTGTHDNPTLTQWCTERPPETLAYAREYLRLADSDDLGTALIRSGMASKANLFIAQMQDYLGLGSEARMNEPGTLKPENWRWRSTAGQFTPELATRLRALAREHHRIPSESSLPSETKSGANTL